MDLLVPALTFALGLLVGLGVGAARAFQLVSNRRAIAGMNAGLARFWPETLPARSAADILAGRVRVVLGGVTYDLPVLPRAASKRWIESLDGRFASLAQQMDAAADDTPAIITLLLAQADGLYAMLRSYDETGVLPEAGEIDEYATDIQILRAVLEVWRAANPLAATLAEMTSPTDGSSSEPSSSAPASTAGPLVTSSMS